jgi:hypothetical protein
MLVLFAAGCGPRLGAIRLGEEHYRVGFSADGIVPVARHLEPPDAGNIVVVAGPPITERWSAQTDPLPLALAHALTRSLTRDVVCEGPRAITDVEVETDVSLVLAEPRFIDTSNFWRRKYDVRCTSALTGRLVARLCSRSDDGLQPKCSDVDVPLSAAPVHVVGLDCLGLVLGERHRQEWIQAHERLFAAAMATAESQCSQVPSPDAESGR